MEISRLEAAILYLLMKTQQRGQDNLSKFEIMKHLYLIQAESYRYTGHGFFDLVAFVRHKNGPLSFDVYTALSNLDGKYIKIWEEPSITGYPYPRACHKLSKEISEKDLGMFDDGEMIFLNSVLESHLDMTQSALKEIVYNTEPMLAILEEESGGKEKKINKRIDFHKIPLDDSVIEAIAA